MKVRLFTHTIWIARPREHVFDYFIDFRQAARWRSYVRSMELIGPEPVRPGARVHVILDVGGRDYTFDLEVIDCDRPVLWRHRTDEIDFHGAIEDRFEPEQEGTRVTMRCDVTPVGWYGWLALPLMLLRRGQSYADQLPQLKRMLEGT